MITINREIKGSVLDIGGGGEGVISSIYGADVVAIDLREEELNEINPAFLCRKMVMDASDLTFQDATFDNVTAFYSFMFIDKNKHASVVSEAFRVLRTNGLLHIWDTALPDTEEVVFVDAHVNANGQIFTPTYGISKPDSFQDADYMRRLCCAAGFQPVSETVDDRHFHQVFCKK